MLKYGIFDWIEHRDGPLNEVYEQRLRMLEYADAAGFYAYHVAEHQGTTLSLDAEPAVFLTAASQRTTRLRLGALVFCLPWYNPLRLYNQICMLDQLSNGRLELGFGRGVSAVEGTYFGIESLEQARDMSAEVLDILMQGFASDRLEYEGKHYKYDGVRLMTKPYQQPYPPLWYPTSNIESVPYVAKHGFNTSHNFATNAIAKPHIALYKEEWLKHRDDPDRLNAHVPEPLISNSRYIYVADTDERAFAEAEPEFAQHMKNHAGLQGAPAPYQRREAVPERRDTSRTLEARMASGTALVGSPETVRRKIQEMVAETGINYVLGVFNFGHMPLERVKRSMELFADEVMPALAEAQPV